MSQFANVQAQTDDLHLLVATLPRALQQAVQALAVQDLLEIVIDLGRLPQVRYPDRAVELGNIAVTHDDIHHVVHSIGEFGADNRAGIEGTLHRISAIRNRKGDIIGLTLRVGRAVFGTIDLIRDLVESGNNLLLLGRPGMGKTTKLREVARVLADDFSKRVVVIDTSNEIGGDGDIPHPAIGGARRMQVPHPNKQHDVMIEAVENHMPEVIIVDEIGTEAETIAARTIAERGVQLIGTAHGNTLENLVMNPTLSDLIGGVQTVTLGDEEARFRGTQKTVTERKGPPTFDSVVEIVDRDEVIIHFDTAEAVDILLSGSLPTGVQRSPEGEAPMPPSRGRTETRPPAPISLPAEPLRIYPYALSRDSVQRVLRDLQLNGRTVRGPQQANLILALRGRSDDRRLQAILGNGHTPLHTVRKNTTAQIRRTLQNLFMRVQGIEDSDVNSAVKEAEEAAQRVLSDSIAVELTPQPAALRKLQHQVVMRYHLAAESVGSEPQRHLVIHPPL